MLELNDARWATFNGGYRQPFDASILLKELEKINDKGELEPIIDELWEELYHQGDVDLASYYAVPHLIRIAASKTFAIEDIVSLITSIDIARHSANPPLPNDLGNEYTSAILTLKNLGLALLDENWNLQTATVSLSAIALAKGQIEIAKAIINLSDPSTLQEFNEGF
ncbi:hypothetical protein ACXZ1K_13610 [Pedobacter sp. PWIIR3]